MNRDGIWDVLSEVIRTVFDTRVSLSRDTTASDVDGWDSVAHIQLLLAVERRFGIRFNTGEMAAMKNVGEMADTIARKQPWSSSRS
jgi:acyl carrier protein